MAPSSRFALSLNPNVAYLVLNFCALWKKQTNGGSESLLYNILHKVGLRGSFICRRDEKWVDGWSKRRWR